MTIAENIKPTSFAFNNTGRCQSRCKTCAGWETPASEMERELTTQEWKDIIFKMHEWIGNFTFIFSGGEPFLREDIFELAEYAKSLGITPNVITNGLALTDKCEQLVDSAFNVIVFSLNSVENPDLHIESRGRKDSFKKTMDVIQNLCYLNKKKNAGKYISISTVVMPSNLSEIRPLAEFAKIEGIGVGFQLLDNGDAFILPPDSSLNDDKLTGDISKKALAAVELMIELKKQGYPVNNGFPQLEAFKSLMQKPKEEFKQETPIEIVENAEIQSQTEAPSNPEENVQPEFSEESKQETLVEIVENDEIQSQVEVSSDSDENVQPEFKEEPIDVRKMQCQVGYNNFSIDPYGDVRICFCFDPIGSLRESSPYELWVSEKAEMLRDKISKCPRSCKLLNCNFKE